MGKRKKLRPKQNDNQPDVFPTWIPGNKGHQGSAQCGSCSGGW
ncbi:hypothetical protein Nmel_002972, partial [Mimus melanotis]